MSRKKTGLSSDIKVRLTEGEKDLLRRTSVRRGVDMSVLCRSVLVDFLTNDPTQREQMVAFEQTIVHMMAHVVRTRALLNADLQTRYRDDALDQVVAVADSLELALTGVAVNDDDE